MEYFHWPPFKCNDSGCRSAGVVLNLWPGLWELDSAKCPDLYQSERHFIFTRPTSLWLSLFFLRGEMKSRSRMLGPPQIYDEGGTGWQKTSFVWRVYDVHGVNSCSSAGICPGFEPRAEPSLTPRSTPRKSLSQRIFLRRCSPDPRFIFTTSSSSSSRGLWQFIVPNIQTMLTSLPSKAKHLSLLENLLLFQSNTVYKETLKGFPDGLFLQVRCFQMWCLAHFAFVSSWVWPDEHGKNKSAICLCRRLALTPWFTCYCVILQSRRVQLPGLFFCGHVRQNWGRRGTELWPRSNYTVIALWLP